MSFLTIACFQVFFTDVGGEEPVHMVKVSMNATLAELKAAMAPKLNAAAAAGATALKPEELKLKRADGTSQTGIQRVSLKGQVRSQKCFVEPFAPVSLH